ncbi:ABC transporter ATP-binding protein [Actinospongicola halichondriae]|uniref:ABC transporter ATP-binding protein n=1 Tax=Actinospongicola halichondriae TaxID=3236844 RepID=UPI003D54B40D
MSTPTDVIDAPTASALRRLWQHARPYRRRVGWATLHSVLNKIFDLAPPLLIGLAVDVVANDGDAVLDNLGLTTQRSQIVGIAVLTFVVWAFESLFEFFHRVAWRNLAQDLQHDLRIEAYGHVQELEHAWFQERATGDLMAVLNDDVNQLERFLDIGANEIIQVLTTVLAVGAVFVILDPIVALLAIAPMPLILYGSFWFQRKLEPRYEAVRNQAGFLNGQLANNILGISTVKSFTAEDRETARIADESNRYRDTNRSAISLSSAFTPLIRMAILVGFTGTMIWGGFEAIRGGTLTVGQYSVLLFLSQRLLWPLTRLGETFDQYQRAMASTNRILDVVDTEPTIVGGSTRLSLAKGDGHVVFEDVTFAYDDAGNALDAVRIDLAAGTTTAVVGPTGSGKSTLVRLLLRFYDPDEGRVTIDGHDVRDLDLGDLRRLTGLVSQDVYLFHGSVRENIAYGRPDASLEDVVAAATVAEVHEFVMTLPAGYDTIVGERGQKLSGGQRQRISIARAILKDPVILLLDEATSAVDNETEAAIQRSLDRISADRTTLVIAHRLSTVRNADVIHVLDRGRIVERGTHDELVAREGPYAALWAVQTGEAVRRDH